MPDTTAKPKLDDRTIVRRLQAMGATWDPERRTWSVANERRPALVALLLDAGYNVEQADQTA